jgi:hypothetical protein
VPFCFKRNDHTLQAIIRKTEMDMAQIPTTDQIRNAIDRGVTGEKVAHPDPAVAPLGTDAEAGGHPPTKHERVMEARARTLNRERQPVNGVPIYLAMLALVAAAILIIGTIAS